MIHLKSCVSLLLIQLLLTSPLVSAQARSFPSLLVPDTVDSPVERDKSTPGASEETLKGLRFRLSEGAPASEKPPETHVAPATRLSDSEAENVLKRLPPVKAEADDEQDFTLRDRSLPPPRTGKTINAVFPQPVELPAPDAAANARPLEVLRHSPEGDVPLAPQLSVTFSQPMVAVTSLAELAAGDVPVRLTPQPPGRWRWVGTKTLLFVPEGRFPMATSYQVSVPAGTRSATGAQALAKASTWSFATPPPQLKTKYPEGGPQRRDALVFLEFDQRINTAAVLRTIKLSSGTTNLNVREATAQEIEADETVRKLVAAAEKDRWIVLRAASPSSTDARTALPADANITVTIGPGTPSAEGPRTTTKAEEFSFRTFGPLRVVEHECGYNQRCTPFDTWRITFTNPLDDGAFQKSNIRIEPEVTGIKTTIYGSALHIEGVKKGRTTYKVTLDKSIRDQFGQTLGADVSVTFNVGPAPQALTSNGEGFVTLDPSGPPRFSIFSINHDRLRVSMYRVGPEHWVPFTAYMRYAQGYEDEVSRKHKTPPGRQVMSKEMVIKSAPDELVETGIDLSPALESGLGQVILIVEPLVQPKNRWERRYIRAWVQATQIGLDAFVDRTDLIGWANSLKDGQPLRDVQMRIWPSEQTGTSGADGVARIALPSTTDTSRNLLVARKGSDLAILPEYPNWWSSEGSWHNRAIGDSNLWYVFDDRKMYRPGEEVHIKGWLRRMGNGKDGDVGPLNGTVTKVSYTLKDSRDNEITKGELPLNALGGFDTVLKLPGTMNLGSATMEMEAGGGTDSGMNHTFSHSFEVQEFRRPEFEVKAQASEGPHIVGGHADASVSAAYYAGGGLPNTEVSWRVTSTPGNYTPPNRDDYTFGKWIPWWIAGDSQSESHTETFTGRTDAAGKHHLRIDFDSVNPPRASSVMAQASVTDVNRQTWTSSTSMLVHPADLYVGLRSERYFVQQGEPLVVQSIVTDIDGKLVAGRPIKMRAVLLDWTYKNGEWKQEETNAEDCTIKSGADAVKCTFQPKTGGTYRVTARIMDDRERPNESELTLWVAGGKTPPRRDVEQETVEMIPDRKEYKPGDTAEVLVQAPFYPAEGVWTLRRSGIIKSERFHMDGPTVTLKVPIEARFIPNIYLQVDLVGAAARVDDAGQADERLPKRPAFAKGELNLSVPPMERRLLVAATPRDKALEPGAETVVNVEVRDAQSKPVAGSEVAVVVVDESVLALTNYTLQDPLSVFYAQRGGDASDYHLRQNILLSNPKELSTLIQAGSGAANQGVMESVTVTSRAVQELPAPSPMAAGGLRKRSSNFSLDGADNNEAAPINLRENFNALAVFAAAVPTDASGRAQVRVKVPDNLTRYRVMAVSVAGAKQFGYGESAIMARQPLMVRPSAPRFLNFGDRFELPVVVQNQTDSPMTVDVAVRATNAEMTDGAGRRVVVPANDRAEVRLPVAASRAGTARFQMGAVAGRWADAAEISLPVWTPATTEAFATYGELDEGAITQPVRAPGDVFKQFGGLEITTSSTQLQELTDAVLYLMAYPYECSEQISSRVLAVAALRDVLAAFAAKGMPKPEEIKAAMARDIKRLRGLQREDGGFGFWRRDEEAWPYVSIHVAHALQRAHEKKFEVPDGMLDKSKQYLRNIEQHIPSTYPLDVRRALIAYALYVRHRMGDRDAARARKLILEAGLENLSLEAVGWLLPVLSGDAASKLQVEAIRKHLNNRASETAATAHFTTSYTDGEYLLLHSKRRADGIILEALIGDQPSSDLIPKVVRGLLANRTAGRWDNTQENVFILLALDRYFATYEKVTPDFVARAWLGDSFAGEKAFRGRTTERQQVNVPMRYLAERQGDQNLVLSKTGPGRLYYRIGMQYAPTSLKLNAADYGFTVERVYEALDNPADVRRDAEGVWHIKAGAKVRVRLTMAAPSRRYHVALVDPMPAGLEALNPALAVTESIPQDERMQIKGREWWWWSRPWFEHQNMRDERVEAFTSLLWEGVYTYSYVARATTPGNFVVPPAKAEEMYHPENFGRTSSDRVSIE